MCRGCKNVSKFENLVEKCSERHIVINQTKKKEEIATNMNNKKQKNNVTLW